MDLFIFPILERRSFHQLTCLKTYADVTLAQP